MKKHTAFQQKALDQLVAHEHEAATFGPGMKLPLTSWDFGAGTVAWLRKRSYVEPRKVAGAEGSKLIITDAGREAQKRGCS